MKEAVEKAAQAALDEQRVVGGVVLVIEDGEDLVRHAFGLADREASAPMTTDRAFRLSSLTKPIVTAAALRLVEEGVLDLTSPVTRWRPDRGADDQHGGGRLQGRLFDDVRVAVYASV